MKTETKQNLWQIVKYLLSLGISAIVNAVKRRRAKKQSFTPEQVEYSKRIQYVLDKTKDISINLDPGLFVTDIENAEQVQRSIDRVVKRK